MAIDPKLVNIIPASQLPTGDPTSTADFLFYEGDALKKGSMSNIYDKLNAGIKGVATQTNAPTAYTAEAYPDGLFERYIVSAPITSPNSWGNISVTQAELDANFVFFNVKNGAVTKDVSLKPAPPTNVISTEVIGQSDTAYALDVSAAHLFVRDEAVGFDGILKRITFAQPVAYALALKFAVLEKIGLEMKIISVYTVNSTIGQQFIDISGLNISVTSDQRIGLETLGYIIKCEVSGTVKSFIFAPGEVVVDFESSNETANALVYDYAVEMEVITPLAEELEKINDRISDLITNPYKGETIDTNGDSITWYDGHAFESVHSETPTIANGYQSYLRGMLGASTNNNGISGATLPQIRTALVARNYSAIPFITITGGVNDWAVGTPIGSIQPQSATFNTSTSYGAVQSMIEHILGQNPEARIFLITPIRGRIDALGEFPETYADMFKAIGKLYGIPVCDWYNNLSFNTLNYDEYYKDIGVLADRKIHVGNAGYKRMGEYLASWMLANV